MANSPDLFNRIVSKFLLGRPTIPFLKELSATSKKKLNPIIKSVGENKQKIEEKVGSIVKVVPARFYKIFALVFLLAAVAYVFYLTVKKKAPSSK